MGVRRGVSLIVGGGFHGKGDIGRCREIYGDVRRYREI